MLGAVRAGDELAPVAEALTVAALRGQPARSTPTCWSTSPPSCRGSRRRSPPTPARRSGIPTSPRGARPAPLPHPDAAARVEAAEGYRRCAPTTSRPAASPALVAELGGEPERAAASREGPLVSVVVRTRDRPALLAEALASLAASSYRALEVVLVNDGGAPPAVAGGFPSRSSASSTPRAAAAPRAANAGIAAATRRLRGLPRRRRPRRARAPRDAGRARRAAAARASSTPTPRWSSTSSTPDRGWRAVERRLPYSRDFDPDLLLPRQLHPVPHAARRARACSREVGPLDETLPFFEDWDLLVRARASGRRSTTSRAGHLRVPSLPRRRRTTLFGERPRERADFLRKARVMAARRVLAGALAARDALRAERGWRARDRPAAGAELPALARPRTCRSRARRGASCRRDRSSARGLAELRELSAATGTVAPRSSACAASARPTSSAESSRTYGEIERLNGRPRWSRRAPGGSTSGGSGRAVTR